MSAVEHDPAARLQRYIDELLAADDQAVAPLRAERTAPDADASAPAPDERLHFVLVTAGGLRVAVPADAVGPAPDESGAAGLKAVDLGAVLRGSAPAASAPPCRLALAAHPDTALAVDAVEGPLAVAPEALTRRGSRAERPWLIGMIAAHRAVVVAVDELIHEENDRGS